MSSSFYLMDNDVGIDSFMWKFAWLSGWPNTPSSYNIMGNVLWFSQCLARVILSLLIGHLGPLLDGNHSLQFALEWVYTFRVWEIWCLTIKHKYILEAFLNPIFYSLSVVFRALFVTHSLWIYLLWNVLFWFLGIFHLIFSSQCPPKHSFQKVRFKQFTRLQP